MEKLKIDSLTLWHLKIPLQKPYNLSFGSVYAFDSVYARVTSGDLTGWGETTPLPGYSDETFDDAWAFVNSVAEEIPGKTLPEALSFIQADHAPGFCYAPLHVAMEELLWQHRKSKSGHKITQNKEERQVPIVGIMGSRDISAAINEAQDYISAGYQTLKIKIALPPLNVAADAEFCVKLREAFPSVKLRVDANQGYTFDQASSFVHKAQNAQLELFEQPFPVDQWKDMQKLYQVKGNIPLMLDESIVSLAEIEKVYEMECADFIKLKLMKQGSMDTLLKIAKKAKEYNLKVIIGNGVQTELGCLQEAKLHYQIDPEFAGEENGFLKQKFSMLNEKIKVTNGKMVLTEPLIDTYRLDEIAEKKIQFSV